MMQKHSRSFLYKRGDLVLSFILFISLSRPSTHTHTPASMTNTITFAFSTTSHSLPHFFFTTFYSLPLALFSFKFLFGIIFGQCVKQLSIEPPKCTAKLYWTFYHHGQFMHKLNDTHFCKYIIIKKCFVYKYVIKPFMIFPNIGYTLIMII